MNGNSIDEEEKEIDDPEIIGDPTYENRIIQLPLQMMK